jgi:hypothetical protein
MLSIVTARVETEGPWIKFKKPILEDLQVIDPRAMSAALRRHLLEAYEQLSGEVLRPLPEIDRDEVRSRIDGAVVRALGLRADLAPIRGLMAVEPLIIGGRHR